MPTILAFDDAHAVWVTEPLDEVAAALRDASGQTPPLARLTMNQGETAVLINGSLVRAMWERPEPGQPRSVRVGT
jgi:hypothetical protein